MKQLQKSLWPIGLLLVSNSLVALPAHAQAAAEQQDPNSFQVTGNFLMRSFYDCKPYEANPDFSPASIPLKEDKNKRQRVGFDIPAAELGLTKTLPWGDNTMKFVVQSSLGRKSIKLKKIYIDHNKFRVGLTASNFGDGAAMPSALTDAPCSAAGGKTAQLAYKHQLETGLSFVIAAEKALELAIYPEVKKEEDKAEEKLLPVNNLPAVSANVKYEKALGYVRVGGLLRVLDYYEQAAEKTHYKPAWGANLSSTLKIIPDKTTIKLYGVYGMGIGSYLVDFAYTPQKERKDVYLEQDTTLVLIGTWGGYVGLEHCWLPKLRSTIVYGLLDTTNKKERGNDAYKQGHYASANLTYHPTENLTFGVEYLYGKRLTIDNKDGQDAHRIQAAVGFNL